MKCDNCGSTAQIRMVDFRNVDERTIIKEYTCGCGATKKMVYTLTKEFTVTKEGTFLPGRV